MVTTNLDGFSLANHRRFAKFAKLSTRQTFPLYGTLCDECVHVCVFSLTLKNDQKLVCVLAIHFGLDDMSGFCAGHDQFLKNI